MATAAGSVNMMHAMRIYKDAAEETCSIANEKQTLYLNWIGYIFDILKHITIEPTKGN